MKIRKQIYLRIFKGITHANFHFEPPYVGCIVREKMAKLATDEIMQLIQEGVLDVKEVEK